MDDMDRNRDSFDSYHRLTIPGHSYVCLSDWYLHYLVLSLSNQSIRLRENLHVSGPG